MKVNPELRQRLEVHRRDFERVTGRPFEHFYCPILGVDQEVALQRGHVINEAFENSTRVWVVQRRDVDGFFGSHFEADFEVLQHRDRLSVTEVLADPKLARKVRVKILRSGAPVPFTTRGGDLPHVFTPFQLVDPQGATSSLGLKMSTEEIAATAGEKWEYLVLKDARVSALVSLIKAAHLSAFHMLGYRYALGLPGRFIGTDILGRFYRENFDKPRKTVRDNAWAFFKEFQHMVRPVLAVDPGAKGTVTNRSVLVCHGTGGGFWGMVVYVKTAGMLHAVLLPAKGDAESMATYLGFLRNDNETLHLSHTAFDHENGQWLVHVDRFEKTWPKNEIHYPESPDPELIPPDLRG